MRYVFFAINVFAATTLMGMLCAPASASTTKMTASLKTSSSLLLTEIHAADNSRHFKAIGQKNTALSISSSQDGMDTLDQQGTLILSIPHPPTQRALKRVSFDFQ